jgi:hypothetical protein
MFAQPTAFNNNGYMSMQTDNYKKRAVDVRRLARANLLEIRQARMARKFVDPESKTTAAWDADTSHESSDQAISIKFEAGQKQLTDTEKQIQEIKSFKVGAPSVATSSDIAELDSLDALAVKNASIIESADLPLSDTGPAVRSSAIESTDDGSNETPKDWTQSELARLPGAGPGLIWMLGQCQIETMKQLAAQEAGVLTTQLGVVGQILDVSQWISYARDNS